jgi:AraC-like DNA-binding protein
MEPLDEIRSLLTRHASYSDEESPLPDIIIRAASAPTAPMTGVCEPAFIVVAQGTKRTVVNDQIFQYGAGQYLIVSVDLPVLAQVTRATKKEPYLVFALRLKPASIAPLLLEAAARDRGDRPVAGAAVSAATSELLDPVARFLRLLDRPRDIAVLAPMLEREILWRLLDGEQAAMVRQIGLADSRLSQIARAIRWIRAHYAEIFTIGDLARIAGMSGSSFHRHFRAVTTMSPLQYQKRIRLQEARLRLLGQPEDVAAVGFAVGYDSPSQFSREYSRLFGVPPGQDMARMRSALQVRA